VPPNPGHGSVVPGGSHPNKLADAMDPSRRLPYSDMCLQIGALSLLVCQGNMARLPRVSLLVTHRERYDECHTFAQSVVNSDLAPHSGQCLLHNTQA